MNSVKCQKKFLLILYTLVICCLFINVSAKEATFSKCIDGDTIRVIYNEKEEVVRLLAVDTPETKHPKKGAEPFGKEASDFTCEIVKNANMLELEFDQNSSERDKYDRLLAWIWIDGKLLQDDLVEKGLAKVAYLYGDYKYTEQLQDLELIAKKNNIGLWGDYAQEEINWWYIGFALIAIVIIILFLPKERNKMTNKAKRNIKKNINKNIDNLFK